MGSFLKEDLYAIFPVFFVASTGLSFVAQTSPPPEVGAQVRLHGAAATLDPRGRGSGGAKPGGLEQGVKAARGCGREAC